MNVTAITVSSSRGCPSHAVVDERWQELWRHETAAVSEGLCPEHRAPLTAVAGMPRGRIAGHCPSCRRFWGFNADDGIVGWWLDHDPHDRGRFSAPVPGWMTT